MKNISMKKNINEQREGIWGKNLKSLKSLKSLMQIFAESANSANSAKQIFSTFATFATFAMQIFSKLVNLVKLVMQIFHKGSYSAVRVSSVQQPTNIQRISNLSLTIRPILPLFATVVMLTFGGWNSMAWGDNTATITRRALDDSDWTNINNGGSSSAYITWKGNDAGQHVTFKLSGGTFKNATWQYFQSTGDQTHKIEWIVDEGYTVSVKNVSLVVRSSLKESTVKVGQADFVTNPYGQADDFISVSSGTYSPALGNNSYVNILFEDGSSLANNFIKTLTVTYTIEGVGNEVRFSANSNNPVFDQDANPYYLTQDSVQFKLDIPNYENDHFYVHNKQDDRCIKWTPNSGFTIAVTGVKFNGYNATYNGGFLNLSTYTGKSYVKSYSFANNRYNTGEFISQTSSADTYSFTTSNMTVFPGGNALGNNDYFNVYSRNKDDGKEDKNKAEYKINWVELSYRVTPPAPNRKNYTEQLVRNQYVEGRANNTVDLTEYFLPFHVGDGVSMLYEVKKKVGETFKIIEAGYDITDDVFKTTNVGIYQVRAKTNATGAFTASAWSSDPIQITIEAVQPLTVVVGSQELFVDETTTMTITEQLNTTETVVFDYDKDYFDYNSSTGVLTIKNDGNESFDTKEKSIHITQESDGEFAAVDMYKVFTIKKHVPTFTWNTREHYYYNDNIAHFFKSSNTTTAITVTSTDAHKNIATIIDSALVTYNVAGTARVTMTQAENYYWAEHTEWRDVTPEKVSNHVPFTLTTDNQASFNVADKTTGTVVWDSNGYKMSDGTVVGDKPNNNVVLKFEGIPDSLYFSINAERNGLWDMQYYPKSGDYNFEVFESATGDAEDWHKLEWGFKNDDWFNTNYLEDNDSKRHIGVVLSATARYIRLRYHGSCWGRFENIRVTELKQFETDSTSFDFKTQLKNTNVASKSFKFKHVNAGYTVTATSSDSHYKVSLNNNDFYSSIIIPNTGGDKMDSSVVYVKYYPSIAGDVEETHNATITFSDALSNSATVSLTGKTQAKLATHLEYIGSASYAVNAANMNATDLLQVVDANGAVVASPVITLSSNATSVIGTVNENTAIDFLCGGSATITASYAGDETYAAANDTTVTITVNKLNDVITWGAAVKNDTLRVYADQDIAYSLATAHTSATKPITYTSGDPTILRVTPGESSDALHTLKYDTVSLRATTTADCFYSSVSSSIVVVVLPCKHRIVWNQTFGYHTESDGTISKSVTLDAYAVDSTGALTNVAISYTMPSVDFARIDEGVLKINGIGETTITARTEADNKYIAAEVERSIVVRISGENVAYAYNNGDDVKGGDIVIEGRHATFTISGDNDIYYYTGGSCGDDGYFLASLDKETNATYTLSWTCDESCTIEVTNISFWGKAYNWAAGRASKARIIFNGKNEPVGTAALTCRSADYAKFSESGSFSSPMTIECQNTHGGGISPNDFDFYLKNIVIQYTITAKTPTGSETALAATLSPDDKQTAALGSLFSMANPASDFAYEYQLKEDYTYADIEDGYFWATEGGDYEVQSRVMPDDDHKASEWSTSTIHVTRTCIFNNSSTDQKWETVSNWVHNVGPTAIDAVKVQGNLIVDEEIEVMSMSIEGAAVVEIDPEGGLTVGAGGITGATKDNLKLKAGTEGATKGQTGYLRISPEYTGEMPEATVELYSIGYYDRTISGDNAAAWQCVGAPLAGEGIMAKTVYKNSWIYSWDEEADDWVNNRPTLRFTPFTGYITTQYKSTDGMKLTYNGHLVPVNEVHTVSLKHDNQGHNLLANSFAAPIDITKFEVSDFKNATPTIFISNAGTRAESLEQMVGDSEEKAEAAGQYLAIPIGSAEDLASEFKYPLIIPSMQGFWVDATGDNAQVKLDYSRLVWGANYSTHVPTALRSPKRITSEPSEDTPLTGALKITLGANGWSDHLYMLESERYDGGFVEGYDARKRESGELNIFAVVDGEKLAVHTTNELIGTRVGVRTGEETAYTLVFSHVNSEENMMLWDTEAEEKVEIREGGMYTFFAEPNSEVTGRFIIVEAEAPEIATGVENVQGDNVQGTKVHKFIKDGQLYILKSGVLYDATGMRVR